MFTRRDYDLELDSIVFTSVSILPSAVTLSSEELKSLTPPSSLLTSQSVLTVHMMTIRNYKEKIVGESREPEPDNFISSNL